MLFSSLRAVRSGGCLPLRIALTISAKRTASPSRSPSRARQTRPLMDGSCSGAMPRAWTKVGRKEEATPNEEYKMAYRTINPSRDTESRRLGSAITVMARAAFARRHIACAKDQRSSHFGACRVCFQLAGRRGVTVLKPLVFGNHLRAKQEDDAGDFEAQQPDNRGRQRAVDDADD